MRIVAPILFAFLACAGLPYMVVSSVKSKNPGNREGYDYTKIHRTVRKVSVVLFFFLLLVLFRTPPPN